jgi:hypothetical protein
MEALPFSGRLVSARKFIRRCKPKDRCWHLHHRLENFRCHTTDTNERCWEREIDVFSFGSVVNWHAGVCLMLELTPYIIHQLESLVSNTEYQQFLYVDTLFRKYTINTILKCNTNTTSSKASVQQLTWKLMGSQVHVIAHAQKRTEFSRRRSCRAF